MFRSSLVGRGLTSAAIIAFGLSAPAAAAGWPSTFADTRPASDAPTSTSVLDSGKVFAWGYNGDGQTRVPKDLPGVTAVAAYFHSLALTSEGKVVAWGANPDGQATVPTGLSGVKAIAAGAGHSLALTTDGNVVGWGANNVGQATPPSGLSGVKAIAAGAASSLALTSGGTVVAWGYHSDQLPTLTGVTAIAAGGSHGLALLGNGTVAAWGSNRCGESTVPANLTGVVAIAAGEEFSVALKGNGTVVAWGYNGEGQVTNVPVSTDVTSIAAGPRHALALKKDGTVSGWGDNGWGEASGVSGIGRISAIAAGGAHSLAIYGVTVADTTPPTVGARTPANGATGVARNTAASVTFSEAVTGVSSTSLQLRDDTAGKALGASVTYNPATFIATIKPTALLPVGHLVRIVGGSAIHDGAGNPFASTIGTFTVSTDGTAPKVSGRVPASNARSASRTANLTIVFSEAVKGVSPTTIRLKDTRTGKYVGAVVTWSASKGAATINPKATLASARKFTVLVSKGITDAAGNALAATSWSFTTKR